VPFDKRLRSPVYYSCLASLLMYTGGSVASSPEFPNHCLPGETVFLSARMTQGFTSQNPNRKRMPEKILSLCTDKPRDPIGRMYYRYGPIGAVELERVATPSNKFGYYADFESRPITYEVYFFDIGDYSYYVTAAGWMGHGIGLEVYKGTKKLMSLFSGNEDGVDFYQPYPVTPKSVYRNPFPLTGKSVLEKRKPKHPL